MRDYTRHLHGGMASPSSHTLTRILSGCTHVSIDRTREWRVALFSSAAVSDSSSRKVDCPPKMLSRAVAARALSLLLC